MNLKQLEAFVNVAEKHSFSKAARELYLTQPTVSAHVSALEKELNIKLFLRNTREVGLTDEGEKLYQYARQMLNLEQLIYEAFDSDVASNSCIKIAASTIPAQYLLPDILSRYSSMYPKEQFELVESDSAGVIRAVSERTVDIGFTGTILDKRSCEYVPFFDDELIIDGALQQCNYVLKWQDEDLNIIERHVVTQGATAYNTGLLDKELLTIGYNQLLVLIPFDDDTKKLGRNKRFFLSNTINDMRPYKITSFDTTTNIYNGHGYISMMLSEDQLQKDDNVELQICNYHEKADDEITEDTRSEINYKSTKIKSGYKKGTTFTANFYNGENLVNNISPKWELKCNFRDELKIVEDGNKITISVDNDELINQHLSLILSDTEGNYTADELLLEVIGLF